jgi:carbon monoxide dehydrogenase subunit G
MQFKQSLDVPVPPAALWPVLLDLEQVVPCLPGARVVERVDDRSYKAEMKLRLGPMTLGYLGDIHLEDVDESARRAVLRGEANEARGQGTARATIGIALTETAGGTQVDMDVDMVLGGRVAQMGGRFVEDVSARLIEQFGACLSNKVSSAQNAGSDGDDGAPASAAAPVDGPAATPTPAPAAPAPPAPAAVEAPAVRPMRLLASVFGARLRRLLRLRSPKAAQGRRR